jgi:hypothetical protein
LGKNIRSASLIAGPSMPLAPMHSLRVLLLLPLLIVHLEAQSLREKADALGVSIGAAARPSPHPRDKPRPHWQQL